ncbi:hypothetical protein, partial [Salmonella enterica]
TANAAIRLIINYFLIQKKLPPLYVKRNLSSTDEKRMSTKIFRSAGDATHLMWSASITVVQKQPISSKVCRTSHFLL